MRLIYIVQLLSKYTVLSCGVKTPHDATLNDFKKVKIHLKLGGTCRVQRIQFTYPTECPEAVQDLSVACTSAQVAFYSCHDVIHARIRVVT